MFDTQANPVLNMMFITSFTFKIEKWGAQQTSGLKMTSLVGSHGVAASCCLT
jgi:hypothetical protein